MTGTSTCVLKSGNHVVLGPCTGGSDTKWNFASDGVNFGPIKHQVGPCRQPLQLATLQSWADRGGFGWKVATRARSAPKHACLSLSGLPVYGARRGLRRPPDLRACRPQSGNPACLRAELLPPGRPRSWAQRDAKRDAQCNALRKQLRLHKCSRPKDASSPRKTARCTDAVAGGVTGVVFFAPALLVTQKLAKQWACLASANTEHPDSLQSKILPDESRTLLLHPLVRARRVLDPRCRDVLVGDAGCLDCEYRRQHQHGQLPGRRRGQSAVQRRRQGARRLDRQRRHRAHQLVSPPAEDPPSIRVCYSGMQICESAPCIPVHHDP